MAQSRSITSFFVIICISFLCLKNIECQINGVTVAGAQVEVAAPYFTEDNEITPVSSVISSHSIFTVDEDDEIVTSRLDLDETLFDPVPKSKFQTDTSSLIAMCHLAFAEHRPIALSPDLLWHYIIKGISIHINKYSEEVRHKFVSHEGKVKLIVERGHSFNNNGWPSVLQEFRSKIEANLTEEGQAMVFSKFSTTNDVIDEVSCISLMDAMSKYYSYEFHLVCGIPSVTLYGTREDWIELKSRSKRVLDLLSADDLQGDVSLAWWKPSLLAVLDKLIECYDNPESAESIDWMTRIYMSSLSPYVCVPGGDTLVSGWVNVFFPYLGTGPEVQNYQLNAWADDDLIELNSDLKEHFEGENKCVREYGPGNDISRFPKALSGVDFIMDFFGLARYNMSLTAGPCAISEQIGTGFPSPPGTLHAHFGWMITSGSENDLARRLYADPIPRKLNIYGSDNNNGNVYNGNRYDSNNGMSTRFSPLFLILSLLSFYLM